MKYIKKNLVFAFACFGLLMSLGAPLGFYLHDYYFTENSNRDLFQHVIFLHQNKLSTIIYIGLGSNIFFTLFGAIAGLLFEKLRDQDKKLENALLAKQNIMLHLLSRMRRATTIGLEGLYYLRTGIISGAEQTFIINETVKKLKLIDESAQDLILLKQEIVEEDLNNADQEFCTVFDLIQLIDENAQKYQVSYNCQSELINENIKIKIQPRFLRLAFDFIFEWASMQEENSISIAYQIHNDLQIKKESVFGLAFSFTFNNLDESFDRHLLSEVVENNNGSCSIGDNYIQIILPLHSIRQSKSERKVA